MCEWAYRSKLSKACSCMSTLLFCKYSSITITIPWVGPPMQSSLGSLLPSAQKAHRWAADGGALDQLRDQRSQGPRYWPPLAPWVQGGAGLGWVWSGGSNLAPGPLGSVAGDPDRHRGWLF
jgi:hypothetical protein